MNPKCALKGCRKRVTGRRKLYCCDEHSALARSRRYVAAHRVPQVERECASRACTVRFTPKRKDAKFCSTHCKNAEAWAIKTQDQA